jgi:DMSO/TMAO reductase YedYZ molybdopterin-dependent catalytic subunit
VTDSMTWLRRKNRTVPRWHRLSLHAGWPDVCTNRLAAIVLLGALTFVGAFRAHAQTRPPGRATASSPVAATGLLVTGAVAQDLHLSFDDLKKMPRKSVSTRDHAGEMHQYDGVPIGAVLAKAGVPQGAALRGKSMALTVVAEGTDGYRAIFSLAELDDDFAAESVLIVDTTDGQPLDPDQGPLRLVVPGDKRPARWVRMLKSITVVNVGGATSN